MRDGMRFDYTHNHTYTRSMRYTFDPKKREANLRKHGFDFEDAPHVIESGRTVMFEDRRFDYGEPLFITLGVPSDEWWSSPQPKMTTPSGSYQCERRNEMKKKSTTTTFDEDAPISRGDIETGKLLLRKRDAGGRMIQPKKRVTLYLDAALVEHFKTLAGDRGYQTLINDTLRSSLSQADIETTIRRAIREELRGRKAA